jgi:hypothetical protein
MKLVIYSKTEPFFWEVGGESWHFGEHALTLFRLEARGIQYSWDACIHGCTHRHTGKHMMGGASVWLDITWPISPSQLHFHPSHLTVKMEVARSSTTSTSQPTATWWWWHPKTGSTLKTTQHEILQILRKFIVNGFKGQAAI